MIARRALMRALTTWTLVVAAWVLGIGCAGGKQGEPGAAGQPCTVQENTDGSKTISCPDGTTVVVRDGENGQNGTNGADGADGVDGNPGPAGDAGTSCTVVRVDGGLNVSCTDGTIAYVADGQDGQPGANGTPGSPGASGLGFSTGLQLSVVSVVSSDAGIQVRFKVADSRGNPVDLAGNYTINTPFVPRFSLASISTDTAMPVPNVLAYSVYSKTGSATAPLTTDPAPNPASVVLSPTTFTPTFPIPKTGVPATDVAMKGLLVENSYGLGDYTYTFPTGGFTQVKNASNKFVTSVTAPVVYDPAKLNNTHTIWIQAQRQWDLVDPSNTRTFMAVDKEYNFIPSGVGTPGKRELVTTAACSKCHNGFKPEGSPSNQFHGGGRVESPYCNVCHNPGRTTNPAANSSSFVHRLHASHKLMANPDGGTPPNAFHGLEFAFPQDVRNCDACHAGAAQGRQSLTNPSALACGSCHDNVDFSIGSTLPACTNPAKVDAHGRFIACSHVAGDQPDTACAVCHTPAKIQLRHLAILPPSADAVQLGVLIDGGSGLPDGGTGNNNSNAAWIAAAGDVPAGAAVITYDVKSVSVSGSGHPQVTFKLKQAFDGGAAVDVDFGVASVGNTELIPGFVGSPSAYFAFAMPQDGIAAPADFNASASCYIKNAWNGTALLGAGACTLSAKDVNGYYTVDMTNIVLPVSATMLTGGIGYSYAITSARPLTQVNLAAYPYNASTGIGGLIIAAPDVSKVATGFTARRSVVETARCNNCHVQLGVGPTFHAGQRNDAPTCSFCHTPNRTSSGWSANSKDFIHSIHAGRKRTVDFNWHAISPIENFSEVEFPSNLNNCQACHAAGTHDLTLASTKAALRNMLPSTAATGKFNSNPSTNPNGWFTISPYVVGDNVTDYGSGFSYNVVSGVTAVPAATTLVKTPITAACSACHDAKDAVAHMETMGGLFYRPRSQLSGAVEQCLVCHGPGTIAPISLMHQ